jgi:hypothetical protein
MESKTLPTLNEVITQCEMGGACGMYGGGERCAQGVGGEA